MSRSLMTAEERFDVDLDDTTVMAALYAKLS